jgi:tetratricopeptide (TPR) repeat protein
VRAFVLDWYASPIYVGDRYTSLLTEAEQEVVRALQLDPQNVLALAIYAEILVDQQKWTQAEQYVLQALQRDANLMDVHRVYAYVLESLGQYNQAIQEYDKAIQLTPNLTFLYLRAGANYRRLAFDSPLASVRRELYEKSLEYFAKAAEINARLGVQDPIPYLSIARTYSQMGEFFAAARNVQKALSFDPSDPDVYGQLGVIYFKSRNYEGSIPALKCAVEGCTPDESCEARGGCDEDETGVAVSGLPLTNNTVVYYYTYVSVLAALSRPQQNYCPKAMDLAAQIRAQYANDPTILNIIVPSEQICASLQ